MFDKLFLTVRIGVSSLLLHKLRSSLAVLGILIGIVAVIWLVAMGEGVSKQAEEQIKGLGATNIIVRTVKPAQQGSAARGGLFMEYGLLRSDYRRIVDNLRDTITQAVQIREYRMEFRRDDKTVEGRLVGCTSEYQQLNQLELYKGRFIQDKDNKPPINVCVISEEISKKLFPLEDPIGQTVQISENFYTVVGQTSSRSATAAIGGSLDSQDFNKDIYIPMGTWRARIGDILFTSRQGGNEGEIVELNQITVSVNSIEDVDHAASVIRHLLDREHKNKADVAVVVPKELLEQADLLKKMFRFLSVLIAGISLLVGGIGIMNIMLATVTERTREIGIRRALGAKQGDIVKQFLVESVVLTVVGGLLGMVIGASFKQVFQFFKMVMRLFWTEVFEALPPTLRDLEPVLEYWPFLLSFCISVGVGVFFGLYPAFRAAKLDPIEALRHE